MMQQTLFDGRATGGPSRPFVALGESVKPGTGCPACGSLEEWQDALGRVRCGVCEADVLAKALRLAEKAATLRQGRAHTGQGALTAQGTSQAPFGPMGLG